MGIGAPQGGDDGCVMELSRQDGNRSTNGPVRMDEIVALCEVGQVRCHGGKKTRYQSVIESISSKGVRNAAGELSQLLQPFWSVTEPMNSMLMSQG